MTNFQIQTFTGSIQNQPTQLINARDLHRFVENGKQFSDWIQHRISKYGFAENLDFIVLHQLVNVDRGFFGTRQETLKEYHITLDMAKELCMLERSELGQQARRYFIRMEKEAIAARNALPAPSVNDNAVSLSKDRYIELLETENNLLRQNKGQLAHPRKGQRLEESEKAEIRRLHAQGLSKAAIARQIKRSETAVFQALKVA